MRESLFWVKGFLETIFYFDRIGYKWGLVFFFVLWNSCASKWCVVVVVVFDFESISLRIKVYSLRMVELKDGKTLGFWGCCWIIVLINFRIVLV